MAFRLRGNLFNFLFPNTGGEKIGSYTDPPPTPPSSGLQSPFTEVFSLEGHRNTVRYIFLFREMLVSCGDDGVLTVWNTETCKRVCSTETHHLGVSCLHQPAYWHTNSSDSFVLTASPQLISLWQVAPDRIEHLQDFTGHSGTVRSLCIIEHGPDGILCAGGTGIHLWERSGHLLKEVLRPSESSYLHHMLVLNSPGMRRLIAASSHPFIEAYSLELLQLEPVHPPPEWEMYKGKHLRENVTQLVEVSKTVFATGSEDGSVILWSPDLLPIMVFNYLPSYCIESHEVISIAVQGSAETQRKLISRSFPYAILCIAVLQQRYLLAGIGHAIKVYDTMVTKEEAIVSLRPAHRSNVTCLSLISEDTVLVSGAEDGSIRIWVGSDKGSSPPSLASVKPLVQCLSSSHQLLLIGEILLHSQQVNALCDLCPLGFASCADDQIYLYKDSGFVENTEYCAIRKLLAQSRHSELQAFFSQLNQTEIT